MDSEGREIRVRQERTERAERSLRGERGIRPPELSDQQKEQNLEKQILEDLDKIDLSRKKRKEIVTYIPFKIQQYLYKQFADRRTGGKEGRSIRKVVAKANKKFKLKDWKRMNEYVPKEQRRLSTGSVHRFLVKKFGKARKLIKKPLLKPSHISQRKAFAEYIVKNEIDHTKIFFTDEKRFIMNFVPNKQTNQIRLSKKTQRLLKQNDQEVEKLLTIPVEKNPRGVMVAGGVSYYGVGKLTFIIGAMDSCAYNQTLYHYQKDIEYYKSMGVDLIFQQDNSPSHASAEIRQTLSTMNKLDFWPPNSPDLSPIESVWSEVQSKLEGYTFKSLDDFKRKIVYEWNRVPIEYCQRICDKFIDDIRQIYKYGRIKEKHHISKGLIFKQKGVFKDEIENIVYNKVSLKNIIKFNIKDLKKANKRLAPIINKLSTPNFKKKVKDEISIENFDNIYKEILKENENIYHKNKEEIKRIKKIKLKDYFDSLTKAQQIKLCNLVARYNDELKEAKQEGTDIADKNNPEEKNNKESSEDDSSDIGDFNEEDFNKDFDEDSKGSKNTKENNDNNKENEIPNNDKIEDNKNKKEINLDVNQNNSQKNKEKKVVKFEVNKEPKNERKRKEKKEKKLVGNSRGRKPKEKKETTITLESDDDEVILLE